MAPGRRRYSLGDLLRFLRGVRERERERVRERGERLRERPARGLGGDLDLLREGERDLVRTRGGDRERRSLPVTRGSLSSHTAACT